MKLVKLTGLVLFFFTRVLNSELTTAQSEEGPDCPESDSLLPHPDCAYYYQCSNCIPILRNCSEGLYFNTRIPACDHPNNVPECQGGTRPPVTDPPPTDPPVTDPPPTDPPITDPPPTDPPVTDPPPTDPPITDPPPTDPPVTDPPPTDPPITDPPPTDPPVTDPPPTPEASTIAVTEDPTKEPSTSMVTSSPDPATTESPLCPPNGRHNIPYPGNCSLYIRCFDGEPLVLDCTPLIFDKLELTCKPEVDAVCSEEDPVQCAAEGYEVHPHDSNCSKYYECFNGNLFEFECSVNLYFDARDDFFRCNQAELAVCNSECPPLGYHYLPIRARSCKWYKVCVQGYSVNLACGDNEAFDPDLSQCVNSDNYPCPYT